MPWRDTCDLCGVRRRCQEFRPDSLCEDLCGDVPVVRLCSACSLAGRVHDLGTRDRDLLVVSTVVTSVANRLMSGSGRKENAAMLFLTAALFPWLSFFLIDKELRGLACLVAWIAVMLCLPPLLWAVGWLPLTLWAFFSTVRHSRDTELFMQLLPLLPTLDGDTGRPPDPPGGAEDALGGGNTTS